MRESPSELIPHSSFLVPLDRRESSMPLLGIDIGTEGTKTLVIDEAGRALGSATAEYPLSTPRPGWAEQDPEDWWRASAATIRAALAKSGVAAREIRGVGLSGQMHGSV